MCGLCGCGGEGDLVAAPAPRVIRLQADVLGANDRRALHNREHFREHGVLALNLVSSPGSGKTTLLCSVIARLREAAPGVEVAVIEGDQQTSRDAERIRALGVEAVQINTGRGCHLDAATVGSAFGRLSLHSHSRGGMLFIENVGNLVCPALWDLGEDAKVVVVSVTEGEDKPLKYPDMFAASSLMVVSKIDLLPHVSFDVSACVGFARRVNPGLEVVQVSAKSGEGVGELVAWLLGRGRQVHAQEQEQEQEQEHAHAHEHEYEYEYAHAHEQEQEHAHAQEHAHEQEHAQEPEHGGT